ncbi:MAG: PTS lactose/cellobiose transporter subunit IIA [Bifidobacteriaceae bacterium]|jgi:PTS system cellobiose-specific IIA component|nr:PTS lactose/cellobiose transporter subunit IIA [Bifidobacteriaceae bacterium]
MEQNQEAIIFQIITHVGTAKSLYVNAVQEAKKGEFEKANSLIEEGKKVFAEGHHFHQDLLQAEAQGNLKMGLLLTHAEDQLMSAETIYLLATELIDLYKIQKKEKN